MNKDMIFCPNKNCKYFEQINQGNIRVKQTQGKCQSIDLMECFSCKVTFSERHGTVYFGIRKPDIVFDQVMMLLMTRISIKDISRITGVSEETIGRWIERSANYLQSIHDHLVTGLEVTECQVDELWSFVLMKKKTAMKQGREDDNEIGDQWIFIALDSQKKLVIHWKTGKRTLETAKIFIQELKQKLSSRPLFTTDELPAYEEAFLDNFCKMILPQKKGGRGRPKTRIEKMPQEDLKLAQVHKTREKGKVIEITEKIVYGNEEEIRKILEASPVSKSINTSFVERQNGTIRSKVSRLVRRTYSFSKKISRHEAHLAIYFVYYNLIWIHSRLKKTAAWLSHLVDKPFTFRQLFELRRPEFICGH